MPKAHTTCKTAPKTIEALSKHIKAWMQNRQSYALFPSLVAVISSPYFHLHLLNVPISAIHIVLTANAHNFVIHSLLYLTLRLRLHLFLPPHLTHEYVLPPLASRSHHKLRVNSAIK